MGSFSVIAYNVISPVLDAITEALGNGAAALVDSGLVPLADIPIEVAKVLFLNNAVNQGVLTPLGATESAEAGQSIYFLLETNPGPGLGLLLAYWFAGTGMWKESHLAQSLFISLEESTKSISHMSLVIQL